MRWHLVAVKPNQQSRALRSLTGQGLEAYSPQIQTLAQDGLETVPAFPTYVFVRFDSDIYSAGKINNSPGCRKIVMFGGCLAIVQNPIIESLRSMFDDQIIDETYKPGDRVQIVTPNPLAGLEAIYFEQDKDKRAILLVQMVAQTHKISVDSQEFQRVS